MFWNLDSAHTRAVFSVRHMMISRVHGQFDSISGTVDFDPDQPANASMDIRIEAASINTQEAQRDAHLRSPDFLDVEKYPSLHFKSQRVEMLSADRARLVGDLTIKDVTREVILDVTYNGLAKSPWGTTAAGFTASTQISRKDWGLSWNVALETGGWLVGDAIGINIDAEIVQAPETELALA